MSELLSVMQGKNRHRAAGAGGGEERLRAGQNRLLEMIALGATLPETLLDLARFIESQHRGLYCSVLLVDDAGQKICAGYGPHLPPEYMLALNGFPVGPNAGSCGTAMYRKQTVIVTDIELDPLWQSYKHMILPYGFRACWSHPIMLDDGTVLGSFAMYYREVRAPSREDLALLNVATHIASIAIERARREQELQKHRHHLEELVDQRTQELQQAKERAEDAVQALTVANDELAQTLRTLRITQDELLRNKKLAALSSLVAGIAHELNTPIGNSLTTASALHDLTESWQKQYLQHAQEVPEIRRSSLESFLGNVHVASDLLTRNLERAGNLIVSFKQVAVDATHARRSSFMLDTLVADAVAAARAEFGRCSGVVAPMTITQQIEPGIAMDSYPNALSQVLSNLLENCVKHAFEGRNDGTITIAARKGGEVEQDKVELVVRDDGVGITAANLERIFDPFFTTKFGYGGSGLGLSVVHNLLDGILGGSIRCASIVGQGTSFSITLPMTSP